MVGVAHTRYHNKNSVILDLQIKSRRLSRNS